MFSCALLYVHNSFAVILMGKRELDALLSLTSWCLVISVCLLLAMPRVCLQFVIVVFPDHTHLLFLLINIKVTSLQKSLFCRTRRDSVFLGDSHVTALFTSAT